MHALDCFFGLLSAMKKISTTMIVFAACVLGLGLGLFGLNYYHATKCASDRSPDELEDLIQSLTKRLLQAESQVNNKSSVSNDALTFRPYSCTRMTYY